MILNFPKFTRLQYSVFKVSSLQLQLVFETGVQVNVTWSKRVLALVSNTDTEAKNKNYALTGSLNWLQSIQATLAFEHQANVLC